MSPAAAGTAPPPLPRWWPAAPRLPAVKLESLKRWNEERGLWCEKGVQVLVTTVGAFAAFGLMTIAISTDYWLYTRAFICNTTNLTAGDDGPPHRGAPAEKKDPGGLTHSGLWRICCLEGRRPAAPLPEPAPRRLARPLGWLRGWSGPAGPHSARAATPSRCCCRPAFHSALSPRPYPTQRGAPSSSVFSPTSCPAPERPLPHSPCSPLSSSSLLQHPALLAVRMPALLTSPVTFPLFLKKKSLLILFF